MIAFSGVTWSLSFVDGEFPVGERLAADDFRYGSSCIIDRSLLFWSLCLGFRCMSCLNALD